MVDEHGPRPLPAIPMRCYKNKRTGAYYTVFGGDRWRIYYGQTWTGTREFGFATGEIARESYLIDYTRQFNGRHYYSHTLTRSSPATEKEKATAAADIAAAIAGVSGR
jgi:hypothetical protein